MHVDGLWKKEYSMNQFKNRMEEGPMIRGHHIQHIDAFSMLVIDGRAIEFTPTEYLLVMALLSQLEKLQSANQEPTDFYVSFERLQQCASLNNRTLLARHISNASTKLWPAGISIARVDQYGYMIVFEVEGDANRYLKQSSQRQKHSPGSTLLFAIAG
jgi:hypothetical protein